MLEVLPFDKPWRSCIGSESTEGALANLENVVQDVYVCVCVCMRVCACAYVCVCV
jgi:hypothetical protein